MNVSDLRCERTSCGQIVRAKSRHCPAVRLYRDGHHRQKKRAVAEAIARDRPQPRYQYSGLQVLVEHENTRRIGRVLRHAQLVQDIPRRAWETFPRGIIARVIREESGGGAKNGAISEIKVVIRSV